MSEQKLTDSSNSRPSIEELKDEDLDGVQGGIAGSAEPNSGVKGLAGSAASNSGIRRVSGSAASNAGIKPPAPKGDGVILQFDECDV